MGVCAGRHLTGLLCGYIVYTVLCKAVSDRQSAVDKLQGDVSERRDYPLRCLLADHVLLGQNRKLTLF